MIKKIHSGAIAACTALVLLTGACTEDKTKLYEANDPLIKNMDKAANPGDDFFKYANGKWLKDNPIPGAYSSWGIGNLVQEDLRNKLRKINEDALKENAAKGSNTQKIGDFYFSGMDTVSIDKAGTSVLTEELKKIDGIKNTSELLKEVAGLYTMGIGSMFGFGVTLDDKNSSKYSVHFVQ